MRARPPRWLRRGGALSRRGMETEKRMGYSQKRQFDSFVEEPELKQLTAAQAKAKFADCIRSAESGEPVLVTRHGKPVAAIVDARDVRQLERLKAASPEEGLAGIVGKWEGSDELVDAILESIEARRAQYPPRD